LDLKEQEERHNGVKDRREGKPSFLTLLKKYIIIYFGTKEFIEMETVTVAEAMTMLKMDSKKMLIMIQEGKLNLDSNFHIVVDEKFKAIANSRGIDLFPKQENVQESNNQASKAEEPFLKKRLFQDSHSLSKWPSHIESISRSNRGSLEK